MYKSLILITFAFGIVFGFASAHADDPAPISPAIPQPVQLESAYQLTVKDTEQVVGEALVNAGAAARVQAFILGAKSPKLYESARPLEAELRTLTFDKANLRWSANLLITSGNEVLTAMPVAGRYQEMAQLPALKHAMRLGDVIRADDVEMQDFPISYSRSGVVTDIAALVGKTPRGAITPARPLREAELSSPVAVKRNALVSMHFHAAGMEIVATGQTLADAAKGEVVEVRNLNSKAVVRAVVEDASNVNVAPGGGMIYAKN